MLSDICRYLNTALSSNVSLCKSAMIGKWSLHILDPRISRVLGAPLQKKIPNWVGDKFMTLWHSLTQSCFVELGRNHFLLYPLLSLQKKWVKTDDLYMKIPLCNTNTWHCQLTRTRYHIILVKYLIPRQLFICCHTCDWNKMTLREWKAALIDNATIYYL